MEKQGKKTMVPKKRRNTRPEEIGNNVEVLDHKKKNKERTKVKIKGKHYSEQNLRFTKQHVKVYT